MIPKIINYCWFGKKEIPQILKKYIKTWKKFCPEYEIKLWTEENFDINENVFLKEAYNEKKWAFVSDYARLKIIYENGGIYLDTDVELVKNLDQLLNNKAFFAIQQNGAYINTGLCFGAEKGCDIIKELMNDYENIDFKSVDKEKIACPLINTKVFEKHGYCRENKLQIIDDYIKIYPSEFFDPICPDTTNNLISNNTISIHHYTASWLSRKKQIKRKISIFLGQKNVNFIKKFLKKIKDRSSKF